MHEEFDKRGYDYSIIGGKKSLSFAKRIMLEGRKNAFM